jgi:hypothetical protein
MRISLDVNGPNSVVRSSVRIPKSAQASAKSNVYPAREVVERSRGCGDPRTRGSFCTLTLILVSELGHSLRAAMRAEKRDQISVALYMCKGPARGGDDAQDPADDGKGSVDSGMASPRESIQSLVTAALKMAPDGASVG